MHTADGQRIRQEQLERFHDIKGKLEQNLGQLEHREPYIKVKYAVAKMFF